MKKTNKVLIKRLLAVVCVTLMMSFRLYVLAGTAYLSLTYQGYQHEGNVSLTSTTLSGVYTASATASATTYTGSIHLTANAFDATGNCVAGVDRGDVITNGTGHCAGTNNIYGNPSYANAYFTFNSKIWSRSTSL